MSIIIALLLAYLVVVVATVAFAIEAVFHWYSEDEDGRQ